MNFYIKAIKNFPISEDGLVAMYGLKQRGSRFIFFEDIKQVPLNRESCVISDIDDTRYFFNEMGWDVPEKISIPLELLASDERFFKRDISILFNDDFSHKLIKSKLEDFGSLFVKSSKYKQIEAFETSSEEEIKDLFKESSCIIASQVVDFISEYRCFILRGEILGVQHYLGDVKSYPDISLVEKAIEVFKTAPIAYTIDVGVLSSGETAIVECNDAWSIGGYGLSGKNYARFLTERWVEILKNNPIL